MGVWGLCPQWVPGAKPLVRGSGGRSPPEADNILVLFSIQFSRSGCRCGRLLTKLKCMYDVYYAVHTHISGVGLLEHLLTIFYMVGHQLTRFEICQNVNRLNG